MTTTFSDRAEERIRSYGRHYDPRNVTGQSTVPVDLRDLPEFVALQAERQSIHTARNAVADELRAWTNDLENARNAERAEEKALVRAAEIALEAGQPLPTPSHMVRLAGVQRAQWPYEVMNPHAVGSSYWGRLLAALAAEEAARVHAHQQETSA